ncbi:hypothetical protein LA080_015494 [Diaporthe eres]|nr:hypothetical protein LA080_015494 [Diaporthe eres]
MAGLSFLRLLLRFRWEWDRSTGASEDMAARYYEEEREGWREEPREWQLQYGKRLDLEDGDGRSAPQRTAMELAYRELMILLEDGGRRWGSIQHGAFDFVGPS